MPEAVRRLLDKFDYPDRESPAQVIPILPTLGGGGGAPSIVVAASDASDLSKSKADRVCTGTNDEVTIQSALSDLTGFGGRVLLTEGIFDIALSSEVIVSAGKTLEGLNYRNTVLSYSGGITGAAIVEMQGGSLIANLRIIEGATGDTSSEVAIDASFGDGPAIIENVEISVNGIGVTLLPRSSILKDCWIDTGSDTVNSVLVEGDDSAIIGNYVVGGGVGIKSSVADRVTIVRNHVDAVGLVGILLSASSDAIVTANVVDFPLRHGIQLSGSSDCLISGNKIITPGTETDNTYDGIILDGNSDRNDIWNNRITGRAAANQPRYGINISAATCDDNSYLGNRAGPAADYGTGAYNDAGTGTINTWPGAAAPQGDNLL